MSNLSIWTRRHPAAEFDTLVRNAFGPNALSGGFNPAAETLRDGADAVIRLELPGVDIESDVQVEVTGGRLQIRGERRDQRTGEPTGRDLSEIRYGTFERTFRLPASVSAADISADYHAGVLEVRIAGAYAGTEPQRIAIGNSAPAEPLEQPAEATEE
ncbi:MAG TPA: Hsp20/alpha crystallin family protein [Beutenbergiaceae bacterium]|nr:Hsp20/alpha crystallin family protein [Beutenbergiaceae bacterium]